MWQKYFGNDDIFFVTPDVKRGMGFAGVLPNYHIICTDFDPIIPILRKQGAKIFCLEEDENVDITNLRNSGKLLEIVQVLSYIKSHTNDVPKIMYFKPSLKLDTLIRQYGFLPIGNNAQLNEMYEDKINFYQLEQQSFSDYSIPSVVGILGKLKYLELYRKFNLPFVLQFGHGWAGKTTFFIKDEKEFINLVEKFSYTKVKVSKYIDGFTVLNNCCLYKNQVLISSPAIQIDGISELGGKPGVTCGRQWPVKFISRGQTDEINKISQSVGQIMDMAGFAGFFGIDFLIEKGSSKVYLSEVNARMTASSAFFTHLEQGLDVIPLLAYHLAQFLGKPLAQKRGKSENLSGTQVIFRKLYNLKDLGNKQFGVFRHEDGRSILAGEDYYPQNLKEDEYIFMERLTREKNSDNEYGRIETKCEVLDKPKKLKKWVEDLIKSD